jgi:L-cysteate sulfo-lyase
VRVERIPSEALQTLSLSLYTCRQLVIESCVGYANGLVMQHTKQGLESSLALFEQLPRVELAVLPTPLQDLARLSEALKGPRIFVKRDDLTGLGGGGNKLRKLEYLVADAISNGADCLITAGAMQSNHCRQTAAAAAKCVLDCHLVLSGEPPKKPTGNFYFDQLLGAKLHFTERHLRNEKMESVAKDLREHGRSPYVIPIGGSNAIGAMGYVRAMIELDKQLKTEGIVADRIIFGTSSGGTQAGLVLGAKLRGFTGAITGISIDHGPDDTDDSKFKATIYDIIKEGAQKLGVPELVNINDISINYDYLGKGYGVVGELEREAIKLMAANEGLLVGPVYTGRALGALIDLIRRQEIGKNETVLFLHTGDDIALHAYNEDLLKS